jgi:uncharacterized protein (DUF433 family)
VTKIIPTLGEGIFTAYDVAHILKIKYGKVNYWFNNHIRDQFKVSSGHDYFYDYQDIRAINFYSLIELFALHNLRENKIKSRDIIKYHTWLGGVLNTPYPFATSKWLLSGKDVLLSLDDKDSQIVVADNAYQLVLRDVISQWTKRIVFDENDGLAFKYYPLGESKSVVVNRFNQFGQPIIEGTNVKTSTIYSYFLGGESNEAIAELYNLTESQVVDAIEYSKSAA